MAKVSGNAVQLGDSATATQNFVLQTNLDGTAKLSRGNLGATTQDVLTVDSLGKVTLTSGEVLTASKLQSGTSVASTSGTSIDFTGIPSWAKRITVMFNGVSTAGTSPLLVQLGDSGGIENTGYVGQTNRLTNTGTVISAPLASGFTIRTVQNTTDLHNGSAQLVNLTGNQWVCQSAISSDAYNEIGMCTGAKTLSATLDRLRITTVNGTDTFDAGSINIMWE